MEIWRIFNIKYKVKIRILREWSSACFLIFSKKAKRLLRTKRQASLRTRDPRSGEAVAVAVTPDPVGKLGKLGN
jgi:hypothetical protein